MSSYVFPPHERTKFLLGLTRSQTITVGAAIAVVTVAAASGGVLAGMVVAAPVLAGGLVSVGGVPLRARATQAIRFRWRRWRHTDVWSAPLVGHGESAPCLRGVSLRLAEPRDEWAIGEPVGVVQLGTTCQSYCR